MDHRFDDLAKALAGGMSRREAMRRMGGGLAGTLLAALGLARGIAPAHAQGFPPGECQSFCTHERNDCRKEGRPNCDKKFDQCIRKCPPGPPGP
jgi:hypothetical protein